MGSRDGAVMKALASHRCVPGSILAGCHMMVEFVVGSRLTPRVFLQVLPYSSLHKNQHLKFQFDQDRGPAMGLNTSRDVTDTGKSQFGAKTPADLFEKRTVRLSGQWQRSKHIPASN